MDQGGVDLIALEGATKPIDLSRLRRYPRQNTIRRVADALLAENAISGPIHAGVWAGRPLPPIIGIDDGRHYEANVAAVREALNIRPAVKSKLETRARSINDEKNGVFNSHLLEYDANVAAFRDDRLSLGAYINILLETFRKYQGSLETLPLVLETFMEAYRIEQSMDLASVESEREQFLHELTRALDQKTIDYLMKRSVSYRLGEIRHADFYSEISRLSENAGLSWRRFPKVAAYIQYLLLAESVDGDQLFEAVRFMEREGYRLLTQNDEERRLINETVTMRLTEKLVDFALTKAEWEEYKSALHGNEGIQFSITVRNPKDDIPLKSFEEFYKQAEIRDRLMAENLLRAMEEHQAQTAVLVTGGFHAEGIQRAIASATTATRKDDALVSFIPKISQTHENDAAEYLTIFAQEHTPLDRLFQGNTLFLAMPPISAGVKNGRFPAAVVGVDRIEESIGEQATEAFESLAGLEGLDVQAVKKGRSAEVRVRRGERRETLTVELPESGIPVLREMPRHSFRTNSPFASLRHGFIPHLIRNSSVVLGEIRSTDRLSFFGSVPHSLLFLWLTQRFPEFVKRHAVLAAGLGLLWASVEGGVIAWFYDPQTVLASSAWLLTFVAAHALLRRNHADPNIARGLPAVSTLVWMSYLIFPVCFSLSPYLGLLPHLAYDAWIMSDYFLSSRARSTDHRKNDLSFYRKTLNELRGIIRGRRQTSSFSEAEIDSIVSMLWFEPAVDSAWTRFMCRFLMVSSAKAARRMRLRADDALPLFLLMKTAFKLERALENSQTDRSPVEILDHYDLILKNVKDPRNVRKLSEKVPAILRGSRIQFADRAPPAEQKKEAVQNDDFGAPTIVVVEPMEKGALMMNALFYDSQDGMAGGRLPSSVDERGVLILPEIQAQGNGELRSQIPDVWPALLLSETAAAGKRSGLRRAVFSAPSTIYRKYPYLDPYVLGLDYARSPANAGFRLTVSAPIRGDRMFGEINTFLKWEIPLSGWVEVLFGRVRTRLANAVQKIIKRLRRTVTVVTVVIKSRPGWFYAVTIAGFAEMFDVWRASSIGEHRSSADWTIRNPEEARRDRALNLSSLRIASVAVFLFMVRAGLRIDLSAGWVLIGSFAVTQFIAVPLIHNAINAVRLFIVGGATSSKRRRARPENDNASPLDLSGKTVFLATSQGHQYVGMGADLLETDPDVVEIFNRASEILGYDLADLCLHGPAEKLNRTEHAQTAVAVLTYAQYRRLEKMMGKHLKPGAVLGNSSGELAALMISGAVTFEDGVRIAQAQGTYSQEIAGLNKGKMCLLVGIGAKEAREMAFQYGVDVSHTFGHRRGGRGDVVMFSGPLPRITDLETAARKRNIKVGRVATEFEAHSRGMRPAAEKLRTFLQSVHIKNPRIPMIGGTTGRVLTTADEIREEMVRNLTDTVRWDNAVQFLLRSGARTFVELCVKDRPFLSSFIPSSVNQEPVETVHLFGEWSMLRYAQQAELSAMSATRDSVNSDNEPERPSENLQALGHPSTKGLALVLREVLEEIKFDVFHAGVRHPDLGGGYETDPFPLPDAFPNVDRIKSVLVPHGVEPNSPIQITWRVRNAFRFFMFGESLTLEEWEELMGVKASAYLKDFLDSRLFVLTPDNQIQTNGLSLTSLELKNGEVIYIFADTPPYFETRKASERVYIGNDSYFLLRRISIEPEIEGRAVDMGSGSGVQAIAALKQFPGITTYFGLEIDERAANVSRFNASLNHVDDRFHVVRSPEELKSVLGDDTLSFVSMNPPLMPVPESVTVDGGDHAVLAEAGVSLDTSDEEPRLNLKNLFAKAGWGGTDGLAITEYFLRSVQPMLSDRFKAVVYSLIAVKRDGRSKIAEMLERFADWQLATEKIPIHLKFMEGGLATNVPTINLDETAMTMMLSVLQQHPRFQENPVRDIFVRTGEKIARIYREEGIDHFLNGFAVITPGVRTSPAIDPRLNSLIALGVDPRQSVDENKRRLRALFVHHANMLTDLYAAIFQSLKDRPLSIDSMEQAFRHRQSQLFAIFNRLKKIGRGLTLVEGRREDFAKYGLNSGPDCGLCVESNFALEEAFKRVPFVDPSRWEAHAMVTPENVLIHAFVSVSIPDDSGKGFQKIAIDTTSGQIIDGTKGVISVAPYNSYSARLARIIPILFGSDSPAGREVYRRVDVAREEFDALSELLRVLPERSYRAPAPASHALDSDSPIDQVFQKLSRLIVNTPVGEFSKNHLLAGTMLLRDLKERPVAEVVSRLSLFGGLLYRSDFSSGDAPLRAALDEALRRFIAEREKEDKTHRPSSLLYFLLRSRFVRPAVEKIFGERTPTAVKWAGIMWVPFEALILGSVLENGGALTIAASYFVFIGLHRALELYAYNSNTTRGSPLDGFLSRTGIFSFYVFTAVLAPTFVWLLFPLAFHMLIDSMQLWPHVWFPERAPISAGRTRRHRHRPAIRIVPFSSSSPTGSSLVDNRRPAPATNDNPLQIVDMVGGRRDRRSMVSSRDSAGSLFRRLRRLVPLGELRNVLLIDPSVRDVAEALRRCPKATIVCLDFDTARLERIRRRFGLRRAEAGRLRLFRADPTRLDPSVFPDFSFDFIFTSSIRDSSSSAEFGRQDDELLNSIIDEADRLLMPGGFVWLTTDIGRIPRGGFSLYHQLEPVAGIRNLFQKTISAGTVFRRSGERESSGMGVSSGATQLRERLRSGKRIVTMEMVPPKLWKDLVIPADLKRYEEQQILVDQWLETGRVHGVSFRDISNYPQEIIDAIRPHQSRFRRSRISAVRRLGALMSEVNRYVDYRVLRPFVATVAPVIAQTRHTGNLKRRIESIAADAAVILAMGGADPIRQMAGPMRRWFVPATEVIALAKRFASRNEHTPGTPVWAVLDIYRNKSADELIRDARAKVNAGASGLIVPPPLLPAQFREQMDQLSRLEWPVPGENSTPARFFAGHAVITGSHDLRMWYAFMRIDPMKNPDARLMLNYWERAEQEGRVDDEFVLRWNRNILSMSVQTPGVSGIHMMPIGRRAWTYVDPLLEYAHDAKVPPARAMGAARAGEGAGISALSVTEKPDATLPLTIDGFYRRMTKVVAGIGVAVALFLAANESIEWITGGFSIFQWYAALSGDPGWASMASAAVISAATGTIARIVGLYLAGSAARQSLRKDFLFFLVFALAWRPLLGVTTDQLYRWIEESFQSVQSWAGPSGAMVAKTTVSMIYGVAMSTVYELIEPPLKLRLAARRAESTGNVDTANRLRAEARFSRHWKRVWSGILGRLTLSFVQHDLTQNWAPMAFRVPLMFSLGFVNQIFRATISYSVKTIGAPAWFVIASGGAASLLSFWLVSPVTGAVAVGLTILAVLSAPKKAFLRASDVRRAPANDAPTQSWAGDRGGPLMAGIVMPLLEESLRYAPILFLGVQGYLWPVILYSIVHATLHVFTDVGNAGWAGFIDRFPSRVLLSMGFGAIMWAAMPDGGVWWDTFPLAAAFFVHSLHNLLVAPVAKRRGWDWPVMSLRRGVNLVNEFVAAGGNPEMFLESVFGARPPSRSASEEILQQMQVDSIAPEVAEGLRLRRAYLRAGGDIVETAVHLGQTRADTLNDLIYFGLTRHPRVQQGLRDRNILLPVFVRYKGMNLEYRLQGMGGYRKLRARFCYSGVDYDDEEVQEGLRLRESFVRHAGASSRIAASLQRPVDQVRADIQRYGLNNHVLHREITEQFIWMSLIIMEKGDAVAIGKKRKEDLESVYRRLNELGLNLEDALAERDRIAGVIEQADRNMDKAARLLEMPPSRLRIILKLPIFSHISVKQRQKRTIVSDIEGISSLSVPRWQELYLRFNGNKSAIARHLGVPRSVVVHALHTRRISKDDPVMREKMAYRTQIEIEYLRADGNLRLLSERLNQPEEETRTLLEELGIASDNVVKATLEARARLRPLWAQSGGNVHRLSALLGKPRTLVYYYLHKTLLMDPKVESWAGDRGGPLVYGILMPLLEESLRYAPILFLGVQGYLWPVILYSIVHATLHVFTDVGNAGWAGFNDRFPSRVLLSMGFGAVMWAAMPDGGVWIWDTFPLAAAFFVHSLHNLLVAPVAKRRGWDWPTMSIRKRATRSPKYADPDNIEATVDPIVELLKIARRKIIVVPMGKTTSTNGNRVSNDETSPAAYFRSIGKQYYVSDLEKNHLYGLLEKSRIEYYRAVVRLPISVQKIRLMLEEAAAEVESTKHYFSRRKPKPGENVDPKEWVVEAKQIIADLEERPDQFFEIIYDRSDARRTVHFNLRGAINEITEEIIKQLEYLDSSVHHFRVAPPEDQRHRMEMMVERLQKMSQWLGVPVPSVKIRLENIFNSKNAYDEVRQKLALTGLAFVVTWAKRNRKRGVSFMDLIQTGNTALARATDHFDPRTGYQFTTMVGHAIKREISLALRTAGAKLPVPQHVWEAKAALREARRRLAEDLGRSPNSDELADYIGWPVERVVRFSQIDRRPISLDYPASHDANKPMMDLLESNVDNEAVQAQLDPMTAETFRAVLAKGRPRLEQREIEILLWRYGLITGESMTLEEVGKVFKVTRERVRQLERSAFEKIKLNSKLLDRLKTLFSIAILFMIFSFPTELRASSYTFVSTSASLTMGVGFGLAFIVLVLFVHGTKHISGLWLSAVLNRRINSGNQGEEQGMTKGSAIARVLGTPTSMEMGKQLSIAGTKKQRRSNASWGLALRLAFEEERLFSSPISPTSLIGENSLVVVARVKDADHIEKLLERVGRAPTRRPVTLVVDSRSRDHYEDLSRRIRLEFPDVRIDLLPEVGILDRRDGFNAAAILPILQRIRDRENFVLVASSDFIEPLSKLRMESLDRWLPELSYIPLDEFLFGAGLRMVRLRRILDLAKIIARQA